MKTTKGRQFAGESDNWQKLPVKSTLQKLTFRNILEVLVEHKCKRLDLPQSGNSKKVQMSPQPESMNVLDTIFLSPKGNMEKWFYTSLKGELRTKNPIEMEVARAFTTYCLSKKELLIHAPNIHQFLIKGLHAPSSSGGKTRTGGGRTGKGEKTSHRKEVPIYIYIYIYI